MSSMQIWKGQTLSDKYLEAAAKAVQRRIGLGSTPLVMAEQYALAAVEAWVGNRELYEIVSNHTYVRVPGLEETDDENLRTWDALEGTWDALEGKDK